MKKFLSLLVIFAMIFTMAAGSVITVSASCDDRNSEHSHGNGCNSDVYSCSSANGNSGNNGNHYGNLKGLNLKDWKKYCESICDKLSDIGEHWGKDSISQMVMMGLLNGYEDGTFKPDAYITRGEFTAVLMKALIETGCAELCGDKVFNDTKNCWAKDYIAMAYELGIVSGKNDNVFLPNSHITRQEMAVMLENAMKFEKGTSSTGSDDKSLISSWAEKAVEIVCSNGIMSSDNGMFRPCDKTTRAEAATVILRSLIKKGLASYE